MKFIKEVWTSTPGHNRYIIRRTDYGSSMADLAELLEVACTDFENLTPKEVQVVRYAGTRYSGTFGIEFVRGGYVEPGYEPVPNTELAR